MSKVRVKLNSKAIREFLKSDEVKEILNEHADSALSSLGDGYEKTAHVGKTRVNVSIRANTKESIKEQYESNTILKSLKG